LEQADLINQFFGHLKDESNYFLLMVQKDRSGTTSLRHHFESQMETILQNRKKLTERLGKKNELSMEDHARYYSSWHFAAIHIALTIPELQNAKALADHFRLPIKKVNSALEFLSSVGLAKKNGENYRTGTNEIRIGADSPNITKHHTNFRQYAIDALDREGPDDLHYSAVVSLSKKDAEKIKDRILENLRNEISFIKNSKEEDLYIYNIDFFNSRRG
jgi:uncharacterized protein (TIGR02147 family)